MNTIYIVFLSKVSKVETETVHLPASAQLTACLARLIFRQYYYSRKLLTQISHSNTKLND